MQQQPYCTIFLFINDASGGGVGSKLLMQEIEKVEFSIGLQEGQTPKCVHVYMFEMLTKRQKGFKLLKEVTDRDKPAIAIICGGDGTIMWVVSEMQKYKVDAMRVALGVIPLGTGNDFSQYLGWGKEKTSLVENGFRSLKKLIKKWLVATREDFDLWHMKAQIYESGRFERVNKKGENEVVLDSQTNRALTVQYNFCNYFSFGIDGKIGYSFDKRRTKSRTLNLMVYGTMGMVKAATKTKSIQELVDKMQVQEYQMGDEYIQPQSSLSKPKMEVKDSDREDSNAEMGVAMAEQKYTVPQSKLIFRSTLRDKQKKELRQLDLKNDYLNFLALNINSFMGGVTDIWQNAKDQEVKDKKQQYAKMSTSDGKLEIVCFSSSVGMALQRMIGGFANKITQGSGPYSLTFNQYQDSPKHRTYLQIDGQFIRFTHPKSILIGKSKLGQGGKIRVLKRNIEAEQILNL